MTLTGSQEGNSVPLSVEKEKVHIEKLRQRVCGQLLEAVYAAKQALSQHQALPLASKANLTQLEAQH
jgi:hypothetical protein